MRLSTRAVLRQIPSHKRTPLWSRLLFPSSFGFVLGTSMIDTVDSTSIKCPVYPLLFTSPEVSVSLLPSASAESFGDSRGHSNRRMRHRRKLQEFGEELCSAVRAGDHSTVHSLLQQTSGADPDSRSAYGWAPLHVAVVNGDLKMTEELLQAGADVNIHDMTNPYMNGNVRRQEFSEKIHANAPTQGWTPLHYAAAFMDADMIELLVRQYGANPEVKDQRGATPLDYLDDRSEQMRNTIDLIMDCFEDYQNTKDAREREYRLRHPIEEEMKQRIIGQITPINHVASAVRRKLNGWHDSDHPLVFLFLGSSGVGKTELAKTLAGILHKNDRNAFIRIDMSEFQHKHEVSKFIGSPPGYVGHEKGGQLTSKLREYPNAVVLLDEVEKAHPDILTVMLQLFDEGRITDGKGDTVECKDAIFVMTSNLAQTEIGDYAERLRKDALKRSLTKKNNNNNNSMIETNDSEEDMSSEKSEKDTNSLSSFASSPSSSSTIMEEELRMIRDDTMSLSKQFIEDTVQPILKRHFQRDEFLGRINEILYFLPFNEVELKKLTEKELKKWQKIAQERHDIDLEWTPQCVDLLRDGYNFRYGARSIQHEVEKRVINQLAKYYELGVIAQGSRVCIDGDLEEGIQVKLLDSGTAGGMSSQKSGNGNLFSGLGSIFSGSK